MEALNSEVLVIVSPVATFVGLAELPGRRVQLVDTRRTLDGVDVHWYRYHDGRVFTCRAEDARKCLLPLSGPRREGR